MSGLADLEPAIRQILLVSSYALLIASSLAFTLGLFTRAAGSVTLVLHLLFVSVQPFANYSWARMLAPFLLYVIFSRAGDYASLDALRKRRGRDPGLAAGTAPAWPLRLLQIHITAMYFHSGFARIDDPGWLRGDVLFEALAQTLFTRFDLNLFLLQPALVLLSIAVFLLEPAATLLLWIPRLCSFKNRLLQHQGNNDSRDDADHVHGKQRQTRQEDA